MCEHPPIPGYELVRQLACCDHLIYLARQSSTGRLVSLNVVHHRGEHGQRVADQLRYEAQVLARLDHPNIVRLIEVGDAQGNGFFTALQYVEGSDLFDMSHCQPLPQPAEIIRIASCIAAALDYAHGLDIVHGNVHPRQILLAGDGHISLTGFGKLDPRAPDAMPLGNPHSLAPEQLSGLDKAVPQTDVYCLAEVVFFLLCYGFPFGQNCGISQLLERKLSGPIPSIRDYRPELPRQVDLTLQQAMSIRPEDRCPAAGQFVEQLATAFDAGPTRSNWWQFWR